jgi:pimeloyl-ACP methyl ester carboxylesterase
LHSASEKRIITFTCDVKFEGSEKSGLIIIGTKDSDYPDPMAEGQYLAEKIGGRLVMIKGAGHYPQTVMPEKTTPAVLEFLKQT